MPTRRTIALLTAVGMLLSLLLPAKGGGHRCSASEPARSMPTIAHHADESSGGGCCSRRASTADHGRSRDLSAMKPAGDGACHCHDFGKSICCPGGGWSLQKLASIATLPVKIELDDAVAVIYPILFVIGRPVAVSRSDEYAIGESPPFLATIAHTLYLRISLLLI